MVIMSDLDRPKPATANRPGGVVTAILDSRRQIPETTR